MFKHKTKIENLLLTSGCTQQAQEVEWGQAPSRAPHLNSGLADVDGDNFTHGCRSRRTCEASWRLDCWGRGRQTANKDASPTVMETAAELRLNLESQEGTLLYGRPV